MQTKDYNKEIKMHLNNKKKQKKKPNNDYNRTMKIWIIMIILKQMNKISVSNTS